MKLISFKSGIFALTIGLGLAVQASDFDLSFLNCRAFCRLEYQDCLANGTPKVSCLALRQVCEMNCRP